MDRRTLVRAAAAAGVLLAAGASGAQASTPVTALGVFTLLSDAVEVAVADAPTDTRVERTRRDSYEFRNIGFDAIVGNEVREAARRVLPTTKVAVFGATAPLTVAEQRRIAEGADGGALPAWIIRTIEQRQLSHVLLVTRARVPTGVRTADNDVIALGRGHVEGLGFFLDPQYEVIEAQTRARSTGAIVPHVVVKLQLMDASSATVVGNRTINQQILGGSREDRSAVDPWNYMTAEQKVIALRRMLTENLRRALPELLSGR